MPAETVKSTLFILYRNSSGTFVGIAEIRISSQHPDDKFLCNHMCPEITQRLTHHVHKVDNLKYPLPQLCQISFYLYVLKPHAVMLKDYILFVSS